MVQIHNKELQRRNQKYLKHLKKNATKYEIEFKKKLVEWHINAKFQKGFFIPFHRIADFYISKPHYVIIEIDGGYHNDISEKDAYKDKMWLEKRGMRTIRIKNEDVKDFTKERFLELLK